MKMNLVINGDLWKLYFLSEAKYISMGEDFEDSGAITYPHKKTICFNITELNDVTIDHELFHANFSYLCLDENPKISNEDMEEINATFYTRYGEKIRNQRKLIKRFIKKWRIK